MLLLQGYDDVIKLVNYHHYVITLCDLCTKLQISPYLKRPLIIRLTSRRSNLRGGPC